MNEKSSKDVNRRDLNHLKYLISHAWKWDKLLFVYYGLFTLTHRVFLPLILSVVVGVFVYFIMIMYIYWEHPAYLFEIPYMKTLYYKIKRIMKK